MTASTMFNMGFRPSYGRQNGQRDVKYGPRHYLTSRWSGGGGGGKGGGRGRGFWGITWFFLFRESAGLINHSINQSVHQAVKHLISQPLSYSGQIQLIISK